MFTIYINNNIISCRLYHLSKLLKFVMVQVWWSLIEYDKHFMSIKFTNISINFFLCFLTNLFEKILSKLTNLLFSMNPTLFWNPQFKHLSNWSFLLSSSWMMYAHKFVLFPICLHEIKGSKNECPKIYTYND